MARGTNKPARHDAAGCAAWEVAAIEAWHELSREERLARWPKLSARERRVLEDAYGRPTRRSA